jgi:hypothetical protein
MTVHLILLIIALVLFALATLSPRWPAPAAGWSGGLVPAGLFCWALSTLL